ncbi:MAG: hypothetical protein ACXVNF_04775 [Neobacillus sp.]
MSFFISDAVATAAPVAQQSGIEGVLFPLSIILLFYFIFRRLRSKRAKKTSNNKFSNIVITGGVIGIIFGLFMDTTVSSGNIVVNNIGLMNM